MLGSIDLLDHFPTVIFFTLKARGITLSIYKYIHVCPCKIFLVQSYTLRMIYEFRGNHNWTLKQKDACQKACMGILEHCLHYKLLTDETGEVYMELRIRIPSSGITITMSVAHRLIKKNHILKQIILKIIIMITINKSNLRLTKKANLVRLVFLLKKIIKKSYLLVFLLRK